MESEQLDFKHVKMKRAKVFLFFFSQDFFGMVDKSSMYKNWSVRAAVLYLIYDRVPFVRLPLQVPRP